MIAAGRSSDVHRLLTRALHARAGGGNTATIDAASSENWASATFRGARHKFSLGLNGTDAAERATTLACGIDAVEFSLPGHLVAEIVVTARRETADGVAVEIEALTVEDA